MGQKILSYSTAIAISLLLLLPAGFTVHAQQRPYVNQIINIVGKSFYYASHGRVQSLAVAAACQ